MIVFKKISIQTNLHNIMVIGLEKKKFYSEEWMMKTIIFASKSMSRQNETKI
jgi:hypothetical protein